MDIGQRIKTVRQAHNMTQEYVAEQLGVSRQTISNWENNRSYPDIISVIKMSDLYSISLDELLKEDQKMIEHLEESTNVVKNRKMFSKLIVVMGYLVIWAFLMILFWFGTDGDDAMGFGLLALWIILPMATMVSSFFIGRDNSWGKYRWLMCVFYGIMFMLMEYGTFSLSNMIAFHKTNLPEPTNILPGIIYSAVGMLIGWGVGKRKRKDG